MIKKRNKTDNLNFYKIENIKKRYYGLDTGLLEISSDKYVRNEINRYLQLFN